jgi:putative redox protein
MSEKDILVSFPGGYKVDAQYKGFTIKTDQPAYAGGENSASSPFDLFLVSLATCAGYYVLAFCRERSIPTDGLSLRMSTNRDPKTKRIDRIAIEILLPAGFPEKYKTAVVRAADSCTVKVYLFQPPAFTIEARIG